MKNFDVLINPATEYREASKLQQAANGSFQRLIIAAMIQSHATTTSRLALAYPNIYQLYKRGIDEVENT